MTKAALEAHLERTLVAIANLPPAVKSMLMCRVEETRQRHAAVAADLARAREAVDDWRIVQKYRIFDAEASAREAARG
jgi:hypothetical protein